MKEKKRVRTKYFGEIEYYQENVLLFPRGLFGFETEREFLLLPFEGNDSLYSLQSLQTPGLAFVALDPAALGSDYAPEVPSEDLQTLGAEPGEELFYYVLCAVRSPVSESTVNLRCPIVIYEAKQRAVQVILEGDRYGMRHLLRDITKREGESC